MTAPLVPLRRGRPARASWVPFGLGEMKPNHFLEMLRIAVDNLDELPYAWRILNEGVCDGCALGTRGLRDWTLDGTHLCLVRLNLLRLNTMGPLRVGELADAERLGRMDSRALRELGRIPAVLRRRRGEPGFTPVSWEEALSEIGGRLSAIDPAHAALYLTSRGIGNEVYYAAQKAWRAFGSPHVDNAARLCHAPSTVAMKEVLGAGASTCSYEDWYGTGLVVFFGSNPANDQPVAMKYLLEAKRKGTRVLSVNAYEEPGLMRYWVPSDAASALFGSRIVDAHTEVRAGGDLALLIALLKIVVERKAVAHDFVQAHTEGFGELLESLDAISLPQAIAQCGTPPAQLYALADELCAAKDAVFVWSMGLTQHAHGTETVRALLLLGLLRGFVGRPKNGLMPIRGHSGVQGGGEMGAYATAFPGGASITQGEADRLGAIWGFTPPAEPGLDAAAMVDAADHGTLQAFYTLGGNFLETLPQPAAVERALARVPLRLHQDIVLTKQMLVPPADVVFVLPARTRYEHRGGITETTTERRVVLSPHIPGHELPEAREEWRIVRDVVLAARPELQKFLGWPDAAAVRQDISRTIPTYAPIAGLVKGGDSFQWGGARLHEDGQFLRPGGRAKLYPIELPQAEPDGTFVLATRRGKQFNSMVQKEVDRLTGASRDHVFIAPSDLQRLGLHHGQPIVVRSPHGAFAGRAFAAPVAPGSVQAHWPEANVLLPTGRRDPQAQVPDYNARVTLEALRPGLPPP